MLNKYRDEQPDARLKVRFIALLMLVEGVEIRLTAKIIANLQRIVTSGGRVEREYGLGRMRTDLLVIWPLDQNRGFYGPPQNVAIDLKILYKSLEKTIEDGLRQTADYITGQGHLVIFDRTEEKPWADKIFRKVMHYLGKNIIVWGDVT